MEQKVLWTKYENYLMQSGVSKNRIDKLKFVFNTLERGLGTDFEKITKEKVEEFVAALHRNTFKKLDKKHFSGSTKSDIKKFLRQFYKWYKGENSFYPKEVVWIRTRISKEELPKEKPILKIDEVVQLANTFSKIEFRILVLLLFDSGFRIQEMLSVTKKDITWEEYDEQQKCFWVQCNESKTLTRKIPVPFFTEDLKSFFNSSYFQSLKDNDKVFKISYPYFLGRLKENSYKLFKVKISPHSLRHSSATYYAKEFDGNMNLLAERYGWSYSSDELRTYIRRSGAYQKAGAKKVFTNDVMRIREENEVLKELVSKLSAKVEMMEDVYIDKKTFFIGNNKENILKAVEKTHRGGFYKELPKERK